MKENTVKMQFGVGHIISGVMNILRGGDIRKSVPFLGFAAGMSSGVPYVGNGRSKSHKGHVRKIKKAQRRRAHMRSLRK